MKTLKLYDYQEAFLSDSSRFRIVNKARQVGFTTVIGIEAVSNAVTTFRHVALIISVSERQSVKVLKQIADLVHANNLALIQESKTSITFADTLSQIISLPNSPSTIRGYTASHVYIDEFAHFHNDKEVLTAIRPSVSRGGRLTLTSTPFGRRGEFYRIWTTAENYSRHQVDWRRCPDFDEEWYNENRPDYTDSQWAQEFECNFQDSGNTLFGERYIIEAHEGSIGLQEPQEGHVYVDGWDLARKRDFTVGITLDVTELPWQVVAFERFSRLSWPEIHQRILYRQQRYNSSVLIDSTGVGDPILEFLNPTRLALSPFQGFVLTEKSKFQLIQNLQVCLESQKVKFPEIEPLVRELRYYSLEDHSLITDCVFALALACMQATRLVGRTKKVVTPVVARATVL